MRSVEGGFGGSDILELNEDGGVEFGIPGELPFPGALDLSADFVHMLARPIDGVELLSNQILTVSGAILLRHPQA